MLLVGFGLYLAYGLSIDNRVLIVTNVVAIAATALTLIVASWMRYRVGASAPIPPEAHR